MNRREINEFIKEREKHGESWTEESVKDMYGDTDLKDAIEDVNNIRDKYDL